MGRTFFVLQPPLRSASQKRVQSYTFFNSPPNFLTTFSEKIFQSTHSPLSLSLLQSEFFFEIFSGANPGSANERKEREMIRYNMLQLCMAGLIVCKI